jgi:DNA-binding LacI/PurR family transcriptional regulator
MEAGVPVVLSGRPYRELDGLVYVDADNVGGARAAVDLLAGRGRRRIATITGPLDMPAAIDRRDGFHAGLAGHGLGDHGTVDGDFSVAGGRRAMEELLATAPDLDAVFAANDLMAFGAMQAVAESGRRVPDDVAIVGFDDSPLAASVHPALTSVRQPIVAMGEAMTTRLMALVEDDGPVDPVVMPTEIVLRDTT